MSKKKELLAKDKFFVGCNYWASHAGTNMWRDWRPEQIRKDFAVLKAHRMEVLRVFPLWPDFQPITLHRGCRGVPVEIRMGEEPLPDTEAGRCGVDEVMAARFRELADIAGEFGFKLIVGLVTGWMSGRLFVPEALSNRNILTDPMAIKYQVKMVGFLVRYLQDHSAIIAWDLGNECNCMADVASSEEAWCWSHAISETIHAADPVRPVISGMHGLAVYPGSRHWLIGDQAETVDVLTTHPYPLFTPYCNMDRIDTFKNAFHAVAETRLYGDIGKTAAFIEEAGTLGPTFAGDDVSAAYLRNMLWNAYAHDCSGLLWWCAHDQNELTHTPYDWNAMERKLGLTDASGHPKATLKVMAEFVGKLADLALDLPPFQRDAVAILTHSQDDWGVAYGTFLLAKKAGFDLKFASEQQELEDAKFYLLPSFAGTRPIGRKRYLQLLEKVANGATLLATCDGGSLEPMDEVFGLRLDYRELSDAPFEFCMQETSFVCRTDYRLHFTLNGAEVLARDQNGEALFTRVAYGKGQLLFCTVPVEIMAVKTPRAFLPDAPRYDLIYRQAAECAGIRRHVSCSSPQVTLTEHHREDRMYVIAVNNAPEAVEAPITTMFSPLAWQLKQVLIGAPQSENNFSIPANDAIVLEFERLCENK